MTTTFDGKVPPVIPDPLVTSWADRSSDVDPADGDYSSAMVTDDTPGLGGPRVSDSLAAAKVLANAAQNAADQAGTDATAAQTDAAEALVNAAAAQGSADDAMVAAATAQDTADAAGTAAATAASAAAVAQGTADLALALASADDQERQFLPSLVAGTQVHAIYRKGPVTIVRIDYVMDGGLTVGSATITPRINDVDITDGAVTITTGQSGAGNSFSTSPTAARSLTTGDKLSLHVTGLNVTVTRMAVTYTLQK